VSRSPRDVQRVKAQGQGKGAILVVPPGNYFNKLIHSAATKRRQDCQTKQFTGLTAVRAPEGDLRLARDPAFRPAGCFRSS